MPELTRTRVLALRWSEGAGEPLHLVPMAADVHQRHARDFPQPSLQVAIASSNNVHAVGRHAVHKAVIGVRALVRARQALEVAVARDLKRDGILPRQLLQLGDDAVGDADGGLRGQAVQHALGDVELVGDGEVDKVGIDEYAERRAQRRVVLEEHGRRRGVRRDDGRVRLLAHHRRVRRLRPRLRFQPLVGRRQQPLDLCKLPRALRVPHGRAAYAKQEQEYSASVDEVVRANAWAAEDDDRDTLIVSNRSNKAVQSYVVRLCHRVTSAVFKAVRLSHRGLYSHSSFSTVGSMIAEIRESLMSMRTRRG